MTPADVTAVPGTVVCLPREDDGALRIEFASTAGSAGSAAGLLAGRSGSKIALTGEDEIAVDLRMGPSPTRCAGSCRT